MASIVGLVMLAAAPATSAAGEVTLSTPFPAIAVAPGSAPSFEISVTTQEPGRVSLSVGSIPTGWTAVLRGGGLAPDRDRRDRGAEQQAHDRHRDDDDEGGAPVVVTAERAPRRRVRTSAWSVSHGRSALS